MRILGINGIRTDGSNSTDLLLRDLADLGHETVDVNYPRVNIFTARWRSRQLRNAQHLVDAHKPGDAVVAHSYGCLLTLRAMELGASFGTVFFFSAAMNDDFSFPPEGMRRLFNIHRQDDRALTLGDLLLWHDFGAMGKTGYSGLPPDRRIRNIPAWTHTLRRDPFAHSDYFLPENRPAWARYVHYQLTGQDV